MARPVRLPPAAERKLLERLGTQVRDPTPRKVRIPRPEFATGLNTQLRQQGLPQGLPEYQFMKPERKWAYDLGFPEQRLMVDVDGGSWLPGGGFSHSRGKNFERDRRKDANALLRGFRVLRLTPKMVRSGEALEYLRQLLA